MMLWEQIKSKKKSADIHQWRKDDPTTLRRMRQIKIHTGNPLMQWPHSSPLVFIKPDLS